MRPARGFGKSLVSNSKGVGLMIETEPWLTPLILLPGVALLIMSTSARFGQIHAEFHHLPDHADAHAEILSRHLVLRSALYRNALISLHASVGLFALGSLLGGLLNSGIRSCCGWSAVSRCWGSAGSSSPQPASCASP
ncbi:MAG: DUF2721 domain-containing protein [Planctomycetota bacterium]